LKKWIHLTNDPILLQQSLNLTIQFLCHSPNIAVRITCAVTLSELLEHTQFSCDFLIPNFEKCWNALMVLTSSCSESINAVEFIRLICIIVDKMQEKICQFIDGLVPHLVRIMQLSSEQSHLKSELLLLFAKISLYTMDIRFLEISVKLIHWAIMQKSSMFLKDVLVLWNNILSVSFFLLFCFSCLFICF